MWVRACVREHAVCVCVRARTHKREHLSHAGGTERAAASKEPPPSTTGRGLLGTKQAARGAKKARDGRPTRRAAAGDG